MALAQRAARGAACTRDAVKPNMRLVVMPVSYRPTQRHAVQNARMPSRGVLRGGKRNGLRMHHIRIRSCIGSLRQHRSAISPASGVSSVQCKQWQLWLRTVQQYKQQRVSSDTCSLALFIVVFYCMSRPDAEVWRLSHVQWVSDTTAAATSCRWIAVIDNLHNAQYHTDHSSTLLCVPSEP